MSTQGLDFRAATVFFDLRQSVADANYPQRVLRLHRARHSSEGLHFTDALQLAEIDAGAMSSVASALDGIEAMTVGGWFYSHRVGEQFFFSRGLPQFESGGTQSYPARDGYVCFCIGTDRRGFFQGIVNGNGLWMTTNTVATGTWNQLVISKDEDGHQSFYQNGQLVYSDHDSCWSPDTRPFQEDSAEETEPIRLMMPAGGTIGEAWVFPRALAADEIRHDYETKRELYKPAIAGQAVELREIDCHPVPGLWPRELTIENWPYQRRRILRGVRKVLGPFPKDKVALETAVLGEEDCGSYVRRKVSFQV